MFTLYDMKTIKEIISNKNEEIIYKTVCNLFKKNKDQRLLIKKRENNGDLLYFGIRSEENFELYKKHYEYTKLLNETCVELKEEIIDLAEKPKVKTLGVAKNKLK